MNKLLNIEIVFENCESVSFDVEDLAYIKIDDVSRGYIWSRFEPAGLKFKNAGYVELMINASGNKPYDPFGIDDADDDDETTFSRLLEFQDITSIIVNLENGDYKCFYVAWDESNEMINKLQTTEYLKYNGSLLIKIGEQKY